MHGSFPQLTVIRLAPKELQISKGSVKFVCFERQSDICFIPIDPEESDFFMEDLCAKCGHFSGSNLFCIIYFFLCI